MYTDLAATALGINMNLYFIDSYYSWLVNTLVTGELTSTTCPRKNNHKCDSLV